MNKVLLADQVTINGQNIPGGLGNNINSVGDVVGRITTFLIPLSAVILLFVLIWGGYDFMLSQGNPEKIKGARSKITAGIIGFILMVFAFIITRLIAAIFGLNGGIL